jgi:hypothetical protein
MHELKPRLLDHMTVERSSFDIAVAMQRQTHPRPSEKVGGGCRLAVPVEGGVILARSVLSLAAALDCTLQ